MTRPFRFALLRAPSTSACGAWGTPKTLKSTRPIWPSRFFVPAATASMSTKPATPPSLAFAMGKARSPAAAPLTPSTRASKASFPVRTLLMRTSRVLPMRMISIAGAMSAISTKITPLPAATSPTMSSATKIWTRTVAGAPFPTTAPFGFLIRRLLAGPPIATATGLTSLPGAGPGSMMRLGALLLSIMAVGFLWQALGVGGPHFGVGLGVGIGGGGFAAGVNVGWFPLGPREIFVPSYAVSRAYVSRVNISNTTVNETVVSNYYNTTVINRNVNVNNVRYVNQGVPGAVTATSPHAFTSAQPVSRNLVAVDQREVASAPVGVSAPSVAPPKQAVMGSGAATNV